MPNVEPVSVTHSIIDPEILPGIVANHYDLPAPIDCRLIWDGNNANYLITPGGVDYVLRIYQHEKFWLKNESDYRFELDWLHYLHTQNLPVSYPIRRRDGGFLGTLQAPEGKRYWALFDYAAGTIGPFMDESVAPIYGKTIAQIHLASDGFRSNHQRLHLDLEFLLEQPLRQINQAIGVRRPEDMAYLDDLAEQLRDGMAQLPFSGHEYGIIGGDFNGINHHLTEENQITHYDFDTCGYGWRAYDLAVFRWSQGKKEELWLPFLQSYQSVRPLSETEQRSIPTFVVLRHLWWMGAHTTYANSPQAPSGRSDYMWDDKFQRLRQFVEKLE